MATNLELYERILSLRGDELLEARESLEAYLGPVYFPDNMLLDSPEDSAETWQRMAGLHANLFLDEPELHAYDRNGPPTHQQIINLCKWKFKIARSLERAAQPNMDERLVRFLSACDNVDFTNERSINQFLDGNVIKIADVEKDAAKADFEDLQNKARAKLDEWKEGSLPSRYGIKNIEIQAKLEGLRDKNTYILRNLDVKVTEIKGNIAAAEAQYHSKLTKKQDKKAVAEELTNLRAQLVALEITRSKLQRLTTRIADDLSRARVRVYDRNVPLVRRVNNWNSLQFRAEPNGVAENEVLYQIRGSKFTYNISSSVHDANGGLIRNEVVTHELAKTLEDLGLPNPPDLTNEVHKAKIVEELRKNGLSFDEHNFPIHVPNQAIKDTSSLRNMQMLVDELDADLARCESFQRFAKTVVDDPQKQLRSNSPVNNFVEVMSLIDMQSFDESGEPYFRDEIVNVRSNQARANDTRTRFGIEGQVVTRGVYINPGEVKRSTYVTPTPGSGETEPRIVIETSHAKSKKDGNPTVQITSRSVKGLSPEEKNLLAFKMAKEMLLQYREGDRKHKIILRSKSKDHADQASRVYAALLILTSAEDPNQDKIHLNPSQIEVQVPGANKPGFFTRTMDSKRQFYENYFKDQGQRDAMRQEVTSTYRQLRQDIGTGRRDEKSHIKPDASDDTHSVNIVNRRRLS